MNWELIGTLLGSQTVIEVLRWLKNRKTEGRVAEAHADSEEFTTLSQTNLFLQQQLKEKEERFAQQTELVRNLNTEVIQLTKKKAALELEFERYKANSGLELERVRCNDTACPWRRPPNIYTAPIPGITKEEYHLNRLKNEENRQDNNTL